jgi:hypothetical protein
VAICSRGDLLAWRSARVAICSRGDLLALLCHDGFPFGDAGFWRHAPILRRLRKSG